MPTTRKRSAQGSGTIRQRKDGTWEARYTAGRDLGTGKQLQKSIYGETQKEVRQKLQQVCTQLDEGTFLAPSKMTLAQWLDIWLKEYTPDVKARTHKVYEGIVAYRIVPSIGAVNLAALKPHQIQTFYNQLQKEDKGIKSLAPKSIKNLHGVLHKALTQAVENGYINNNPSDACKLPRVEKAEISPLDDGQITAFLREIKGHPFETLYIVDLFTGLRQGEILGLTWDCIDFDNGTILVYRQLQRIDGIYKFVSLKNDKPRRITPAPAILNILREHKRKQSEWRLLAGSAWHDGGFVFTNELGVHPARETVYHGFKRIVKQIGLSGTRFHDLRHSYAVAALQSGDNVKTVQQNLGHHTASFTLDVYGHVTERMQNESAARMEAYIKSISNL